MMKQLSIIVLADSTLLAAGCQQAPAGGAETGTAAETAIEAPAETPQVASDDPLTKVTCAEFLETAKVASVQPADDAALAAQDELANGLTWLHGYLYGKTGGKVGTLNQDWMAATAKKVFDVCSKAEKPAETNLSDVVASSRRGKPSPLQCSPRWALSPSRATRSPRTAGTATATAVTAITTAGRTGTTAATHAARG